MTPMCTTGCLCYRLRYISKPLAHTYFRYTRFIFHYPLIHSCHVCISNLICTYHGLEYIIQHHFLSLILLRKHYFSTAVLGVFTEVFKNIEVFARPLESVSADFLKHSVEIVLSKFCRVVRSQEHLYDPLILMSIPQLCAANLSSFINSLVRDLSDDAERARMEEIYLLHHQAKNRAIK